MSRVTCGFGDGERNGPRRDMGRPGTGSGGGSDGRVTSVVVVTVCYRCFRRLLLRRDNGRPRSRTSPALRQSSRRQLRISRARERRRRGPRGRGETVVTWLLGSVPNRPGQESSVPIEASSKRHAAKVPQEGVECSTGGSGRGRLLEMKNPGSMGRVSKKHRGTPRHNVFRLGEVGSGRICHVSRAVVLGHHEHRPSQMLQETPDTTRRMGDDCWTFPDDDDDNDDDNDDDSNEERSVYE